MNSIKPPRAFLTRSNEDYFVVAHVDYEFANQEPDIALKNNKSLNIAPTRLHIDTGQNGRTILYHAGNQRRADKILREFTLGNAYMIGGVPVQFQQLESPPSDLEHTIGQSINQYRAKPQPTYLRFAA